MLEVEGNLWTYPADFRVITTNGSIRKDGCAVMGRGCALEATKRFPTLQRELGQRLMSVGNFIHCFIAYRLFTFPVKHAWNQQADLALIENSVTEFALCLQPDLTYVMPRPGCGNGRLDWTTVRPLLLTLPDTVSVITFPPGG